MSFTVTLPYIRDLSDSIKRVLSTGGIKVYLQPAMTLCRLLVKPKDLTPPESINGVVYKIPCMDCPRAYIGQTGRSLSIGLKEHKRAVRNGDVDSSAISERAWKEGHRVDWDGAHILDTCRFLYPRCILESWHIHQHHHLINRERGPLPSLFFF